jgi:uncharacterized protein YmfQ (DUF2313 family)
VSDRHIRRSGSDYLDAFLGLLPNGQAWPKHTVTSVLWQACNGLCNYWGFVDGRAGDLLEIESDPRLTFELLSDWERNWGLPDPCRKDPPTSLTERRRALVAKMTLMGGQSRAFFDALGTEFGYNITIREFSPYMAGVSRCGDESGIYNPDEPTRNRWMLGPPEIRFYWTIHVNALAFTHFYCNSSQTGIDRLLKIDIAADLECLFDRLKPAQTQIVYDYSPQEQLDFTQPYNSQYLALGML